MLRLTFLGTSAAQPTIQRNLTGLAVRRERELFLVDCGEGTQRQMIRYGTGFDVDAIFFTHFHADHYLGANGWRWQPSRRTGSPGSTSWMRTSKASRSVPVKSITSRSRRAGRGP